MGISNVFSYFFFLFCYLLASQPLQAQTKEQLYKVVLRDIGNDFLLKLNDSTSRVLPIEKIGDTYKVSFERDFAFHPEVLIEIANNSLQEYNLEQQFIVETKDCDSAFTLHSFHANFSNKKEAFACLERELPTDCYRFYFTELKTEIKQVNEKIQKSEVISRIEAVPNKSNSIWWTAFICLALIAIGLGWGYRRKRNANLVRIGKYYFDSKKLKLYLKKQTIELSAKETDLLNLLFNNENKTLEREYILQEVWGDEGDYVGRTLDVFISKLRKKLEADAEIQIVNVRGVGYRFVIN